MHRRSTAEDSARFLAKIGGKFIHSRAAIVRSRSSFLFFFIRGVSFCHLFARLFLHFPRCPIRRDQSVVKRKGPRHTQSPSRAEWCVKFVRGYLANGQIKGLVDNLWRFQSFNARHKTLITLEGRTTILLEPSRRCRFVGFFSLWW